jgi:DnaJ-class molecular chaperone
VLRTGLKIRTAHGVCHACLGRGFTWRLPPDNAGRASGAREFRSRQDAPPGLKVTCPSCGGSGFIDL